MHQNTPNNNSKTHFGLLGLPGGALGGQKVILLGPRFFWSKVCGHLGKTSYIYPRYQVWGVMELGFDFAHYHPPLTKWDDVGTKLP